jgi:hypothetical protein
MQRFLTALLVLTASITLTAGTAMAYGINITIPDEQTGSGAWYSPDNEDNEVEPGNVASQGWDLEGFFLDGNILTMIGGYDFANGVYSNGWGKWFTSGDLFIDINGDVKYGTDVSPLGGANGYNTISNTYGYDYAINLDFSNDSFTVFSIDSDSSLNSVFFRQNDQSNPWEYVSGGTELNLGSDQTKLTYITGLSDSAVGFNGGTHNSVSLDLSSFLAHGTEFTAHFTMGCGNDNLMGEGVVTPEPATMVLMGIGLLGIGFGIRRKTKIQAIGDGR